MATADDDMNGERWSDTSSAVTEKLPLVGLNPAMEVAILTIEEQFRHVDLDLHVSGFLNYRFIVLAGHTTNECA